MTYEDYNITHQIAIFSYTTSQPCKNKLDGSNTLLLDYVASMVVLQTVTTYVTIEHINLDSYITHRGAYSRNYK